MGPSSTPAEAVPTASAFRTLTLRTVLRGKIHRATVTDANLDYEGSITLDPVLMEAAGIAPWELVHVLDVTNGARLETYAIEGQPGSGEVRINGAAAHLVRPDDLVIIVAYEQVPSDAVAGHRPSIVHVGRDNRISRPGETTRAGGALLAEVKP
ncbi:MAG: aspartate 1-decarboxylase [Dehalococcoidia bacterium]|nr:aspartate 1-decarboxylase [Dehalococcoidia bacterium]